jgi:malate synthase
LDCYGAEVPEGLRDAMVTSLIALHDLKKIDGLRKSRTGSLHIVKPKMHGPNEVAFANELFICVEELVKNLEILKSKMNKSLDQVRAG